MAPRQNLQSLLEAEAEPSQHAYKEATSNVIQTPEEISVLAEETLSLHLTAHGSRFIRFFRLLRLDMSMLHPPQTQGIAAKTSELLTRILPNLNVLMEPQYMIEILAPTLSVCLTSPQPLGLRKVAAVLSGCGSLLEHLASHPSTSSLISQWACLPMTLALDQVNQIAWIERLVRMISSCTGNHHVAPTIREWGDLNALLIGLRNLESKLPGQVPSSHNLGDELKELLKVFGLTIPGSRRMIQSHIQRLESQKIPPLLSLILASFPCKHCITGLGSPPQATNTEMQEDGSKMADAGADLQLNILGLDIGPWKINLSPLALQDVQALSRQKLFSPVEKTLRDLASGHLIGSLAGSEEKRRRLKVPLAETSCGRQRRVLWEVSLEFDIGSQQQRQIIIIWKVSDQLENLKAFDRVIVLQQAYSDEWVRRCRQRPEAAGGKTLPIYFETNDAHTFTSKSSSSGLDIMIVDPKTIEMAHKFYTLTEPVIRSVMANDLAAEFPFNLSSDEAQCIRHFKTATLILGRSGTGKTTCLIYKLVGKFLASKAAPGARPAHQIFLTRSKFLADKLRAYTRRLIRSIEAKDPSTADEYSLEESYPQSDEVQDNESVLTLSDRSFPLICSFDQFLKLLENTVVALDRQNFEDVKIAPTSAAYGTSTIKAPQSQQTVVDFHAFRLDYWPRFSHALIKGLPIHLIFSEIMGVIKGSESSRESLSPLSREAYLGRSSRIAPIFSSENERSRVYDIFEAYENMKQQHGSFDYVDRVVRILKAVRQESSLMQALRARFDEVYIDEVQDHRCLDLELLLSIIRDGRGFHFAGDTAQAISQDSTFRFADVKKMLFDHFAPAGDLTNQDQLGRAHMFTLSKNYRSHKGILALASMIMGLIWEGFPETVDKLQPEVGTLNGPKPVLFIGCDTSILTGITDSGKLSERSREFGAEQVILARDAETKEALYDQTGDVALILTILESKGMEFDDVILWNFFSECPDQAGLRSLEKLWTNPTAFDPKKYCGMCSELKNLYVAVTRARNQLFIIESSEEAAKSVQGLLVHGTSASLVDVTQPGEDDFGVRVDMIRPSASVNLAGWARRAEDLMRRRMFREAIMPFRRAEDRVGELTAQAFLEEEEGRVCHNKEDFNGSTRLLRDAHTHFLDANLIGEAVRVLIHLGDFKAAANIWFNRNQFSKAANLFVKAGLYQKAVDCHDHAGEHDQAAEILRDQQDYDGLVSYLASNEERISPVTLRRYSLLCKLLLKQDKLSAEKRVHAIQLLGSSQEQEACFHQYGMDMDLAALLKNEKRFKDLYHLYYRTGQLENALGLALTKNLLQSATDVRETDLLQLIDFSFAGCYNTRSQQSLIDNLALLSNQLTRKMLIKIEQWQAIAKGYTSQNPAIRFDLTSFDDSPASRFLCLSMIIGGAAFAQITEMALLPFGMMQRAIGITKALVFRDDHDAIMDVFLVAGLWKPHGFEHQCMPLPWSPLKNGMKTESHKDLPQLAKAWFLDNFASAFTVLERRTKTLWISQWPERCARFLTRGFYPTESHSQCRRLHKDVSQQESSITLRDLLRINSLTCGLAGLYYRRVLPTSFQKYYLGTRRHWLERLLRECTFLSPLEQDTSTIKAFWSEIMRNEELKVVRSALEDLLYFRIKVGKEWKERSTFTALLEQLQVAAAFGSNVQHRLFRAFAHRLHMDRRGLVRDHLARINFLSSEIALRSARDFQLKLKTFLSSLDNFELSEMSTLHSLITLFEYLTTLLVLKTCYSTRLLARSWVDLYLSRILQAIHLAEPVQATNEMDQIVMYEQCLVDIGMAVGTIGRCLDRIVQSDFHLLCSGSPHNQLLLWPRLFGLLAITMANIGASSPLPSTFGQAWKVSQGIFCYNNAGKNYHSCKSPPHIVQKLSMSVSHYSSKESLIFVVKDGQRSCPFSGLENLAGVEVTQFDQLCPLSPAPAAANSPSLPLLGELVSTQGQYSSAEIQAVVKIQHFWRASYPRIKAYRAYMQRPEFQVFSRFKSIYAHCPATTKEERRFAIHRALLLQGVPVSLGLAVAGDTIKRLQKDTTKYIDMIDISDEIDALVDIVLSKNAEAESVLAKSAAKISEEHLKTLVTEGTPLKVEQAIEESGSLMREAEQIMLDARKALGIILKPT